MCGGLGSSTSALKWFVYDLRSTLRRRPLVRLANVTVPPHCRNVGGLDRGSAPLDPQPALSPGTSRWSRCRLCRSHPGRRRHQSPRVSIRLRLPHGLSSPHAGASVRSAAIDEPVAPSATERISAEKGDSPVVQQSTTLEGTQLVTDERQTSTQTPPGLASSSLNQHLEPPLETTPLIQQAELVTSQAAGPGNPNVVDCIGCLLHAAFRLRVVVRDHHAAHGGTQTISGRSEAEAG
jgi:hypothetical protein